MQSRWHHFIIFIVPRTCFIISWGYITRYWLWPNIWLLDGNLKIRSINQGFDICAAFWVLDENQDDSVHSCTDISPVDQGYNRPSVGGGGPLVETILQFKLYITKFQSFFSRKEQHWLIWARPWDKTIKSEALCHSRDSKVKTPPSLCHTHAKQFCSPSLLMVTSQYVWNILN